ncbi:MAG TPA: DNA polymerase III subunit gamma/tau [Thermomicrobiales bacterium]|nr:DNA polymerase III subunit gamma/tau [Thermomicrobiales bacterium]
MPPEPAAGDTTPGRTQSLYRKHRPATFDEHELVGQQHISRTLRNAVGSGRVAHAYLFCGPRGTGKTTTARLLAKAVNCLDPDPANRPCNACDACAAINESRATDIIEIDAASNRSIDDIRNLREQVRYAPTQLKTKFYIIDEAHQLTKEAFNAFLKTLEEPPPNTIFVLATTEPDKLPETIASRCQRYDFHRIPRDQMIARVLAVCGKEGIAIDDDALDIVVRRSTGSLRDALSLVDMLSTAAREIDDGRITADLTRRMLGISVDGFELDIVQALADRDLAAGLTSIARAVEAGQDMRAFGRHVIELLRLLMLSRAGARPAEATARVHELAQRFELHDLLRITEHFSDVDFKIRNGGFPQLPLELALVASLVEAPRASAAPPAAHSQPARSDARPPSPARPERPSPPAMTERAARPEPTPIRQSRPEPAATAPAAQPPAQHGDVADDTSDSIEPFVASWERIRTEVKVVDLKAAALLASTDPVRVEGETLILVAAYPFHAQKLSEPKIRTVIEDAIARVTGRTMRASFQLRDDPTPAPPARAGARETLDSGWSYDSNGGGRTAAVAPEPPSVASGEPSVDERRLRSAKAVFDAEEVDPDETFPPR